GTPPIANPLVFNQFAVEPPKPQSQSATTQASQLKAETASPQVSPAPQTLNQQAYGLQNLPACNVLIQFEPVVLESVRELPSGLCETPQRFQRMKIWKQRTSFFFAKLTG
ncbi:hypothetical protein NECAME_05873, partial [Necator americanus]